MTEWTVTFSGGWGRGGRERGGQNIALGEQIAWGDEIWHIPAVYSCGKGLVIDLCAKIEPDRIRVFLDKWKIESMNELTDEQRMQIEGENPMRIDVSPQVILNGRTVLCSSRGVGLLWNPFLSETKGKLAQIVLQHYGLDLECGWRIWRASFPWSSAKKQAIRDLRVLLRQTPVDRCGPRFSVSDAGESKIFTHPVTGRLHTLEVEEFVRQEIEWELGSPSHFVIMAYRLTPDMPDCAFSIIDCKSSDKGELDASSFGIIGGADALGIDCTGKHTACSALCSEPVENVEWRIVFHEKTREDREIDMRL